MKKTKTDGLNNFAGKIKMRVFRLNGYYILMDGNKQIAKCVNDDRMEDIISEIYFNM